MKLLKEIDEFFEGEFIRRQMPFREEQDDFAAGRMGGIMGQEFGRGPAPALFEGFRHFPCDSDGSRRVEFSNRRQSVGEPFGTFKGGRCSGITEGLAQDGFGFPWQKAEELKTGCVESRKDEGLDDAACSRNRREREAPGNARFR